MEALFVHLVIGSLMLSPIAVPIAPVPVPATAVVTATMATGHGPLAAAIGRDAPTFAKAYAGPRSATTVQNQSNDRNWISRHPALFGALVGAGAGAVFGATADNELICNGNDEDCLIYGGWRIPAGAGIGAGIGALVGLIVGLAR